MEFRNVLIPTDFNEAATHVLPFGKMVAERLGANIRLVHVRFSLADTSRADNTPVKDSPAKDMEVATTGRKEAVTTLLDSNVAVNFDFKQGLPAKELVKMSAQDDIDLMIIGSQGDYDVIDKWIGTVSTDVAMEGKCPVILVPLKSDIKPIRQILYATDEEGVNYSSLAYVMEFARKMDAVVHFIHIRKKETLSKKELTSAYLDLILGTEFENIPFEINTIVSDSITQGLEEYIQKKHMDLLIFVTRQRAGIDAILHTSFTHKSLFYPWSVPIMVLHA